MSADIFNKDPELAKMLGEWKSQIGPEELPDRLSEDFPRDEYPLPWCVYDDRGNGHRDVVAANGAYVAHVYCWSEKEWDLLDTKIAFINADS
jgi:hypothetical protein